MNPHHSSTEPPLIRLRVSAYAIGLATLLTACGGGGGEVTQPACALTGVNISPPTLSVAAGQSAPVTANVAQTGCASSNVSWTSSAPSTASVTGSGPSVTVTGVAAGQATITATATTEAGSASGSLQVTVTAGAVAMIEIVPPVGTVEISRTLQLTATAKDAAGNEVPNQSFTWNSANISQATVSNSGLVTGVSVTTAPVTIFASVGSKVGQALISVIPATTAGITITPAAPPMLVPQDTLDLTAVAKDAQGNTLNRPISWSSSNPNVASVSTSGRVLTLAQGSATIIATSDNTTANYPIVVANIANSARMGYGYADQPTNTAEYDASGAFSGSGGAVKVVRKSVGKYRVRFVRLQGANRQHNMLVTAVQTTNVQCVGDGLGLAPNSQRDLDAQVLCRNVVTNADTDARFTIMVLGQESLPGPFAMFAANPGYNGGFYAWSSAGMPQSAAPSGSSATVKYGLPIATGDAYLAFANPYFAAHSCGAYTRSTDVVGFQCLQANGTAVTTGFYSVLVGQGRAGKRFGMVFNDQPGLNGTYTPTHAFAKNSANGLITITRQSAGVAVVSFKGLGGTASSTQGVIVNAVDLAGYRLCTITSVTRNGADLDVRVSCYNGAQVATDTQFSVLVIE